MNQRIRVSLKNQSLAGSKRSNPHYDSVLKLYCGRLQWATPECQQLFRIGRKQGSWRSALRYCLVPVKSDQLSRVVNELCNREPNAAPSRQNSPQHRRRNGHKIHPSAPLGFDVGNQRDGVNRLQQLALDYLRRDRPNSLPKTRPLLGCGATRNDVEEALGSLGESSLRRGNRKAISRLGFDLVAIWLRRRCWLRFCVRFRI